MQITANRRSINDLRYIARNNLIIPYNIDICKNRTVSNAVLGECIWNLSYNERRTAIELEITKCLEEEEVDMLINQFPVPADYDGVGSKGTKFVFYM